MIKISASDKQYQEDIIESVTPETNGWTLHFGWCLWAQKNKDLPDFEPKAGDTLRCYGKGIGYSIRGIEILQGGKSYVLRYQTEAEAEAEFRKEQQEYQNKQRREFEENRDKREAQVKALPKFFQDRIYGFRVKESKFQIESEPYEVFCCEQAVLIAKALRTDEAVKQFYDKPWAEQKELVADLSDGHSGNTFGGSCMLARAWLATKPVFGKQPVRRFDFSEERT